MKSDLGHRRLPYHLTRRAALGALAAGAAGYAAFGPRGRDAAPRGRTVVDYWEKWTGAEGAAMRQVVDRFNAGQDRIWVRLFTMSSIDRKALVAIAGGDPPDVLGLWSYSIPGFVERHALLPLDTLETEHGCGPDHYAPAIDAQVTHAGRRWAGVNTCGTVALYYDRVAFAAAGLDPDRPPRTIEQFDRCAEALTVRRADGTLERAGFLHVEPGWWSWMWGHFFGGRLVDPDRGVITAGEPANRRAFAWVQDYPRRYGVAALNRLRSMFGNYGSAQQGFLAGRIAMQAQGPWLVNVIEDHRPDMDYGVAPFPVAADTGIDPAATPVGVVECDVLVVPRGARHPDAALEFIAYTQQPEVQETLALAHAKSSPLAAVSEAFRRRHPNRGLAVHDAILRSPLAVVAPRLGVWPQYRDAFNSGIERIWTLDTPAADVLDRIERSTQAQADRAATRRARREAAT